MSAPDTLDAAWAKAEAALPEGWTILQLEHRVPHIYPDGKRRELWYAEAQSRVGPVVQWNRMRTVIGQGESPAEALHNLAARLRESGRK